MDKTKMAVGVFNKCADLYQEKFMDVSLYHGTFDIFCNNIPGHNAEILEIACGPGNITRYLLDKNPGFKILGTDLAPNMLRLAAANNPEAEFQLMDCRDISSINQQFGAIMCGFCLPYLSKGQAVQLIGDAAKLLIPGGILYLSTMEDDYSKSALQMGSSGDELYMHYHEAGYLTVALKEHGFNIIEMQRKEYIAKGEQVTDLIIISRKVA